MTDTNTKSCEICDEKILCVHSKCKMIVDLEQRLHVGSLYNNYSLDLLGVIVLQAGVHKKEHQPLDYTDSIINYIVGLRGS